MCLSVCLKIAYVCLLCICILLNFKSPSHNRVHPLVSSPELHCQLSVSREKAGVGGWKGPRGQGANGQMGLRALHIYALNNAF